MTSTRMKRTLGVLIAVGALTALAGGTAFGATPPPTPTPGPGGVWTGLPDPGTKAHAPQTDLGHYPKMTGATPAAKPPTGINAPSVTEVTPLGKVTIYDAAPGVTADQLVTRLHATGHPAATASTTPSPATASTPAQPALGLQYTCATGTARATCVNLNPLHWRNNGFANPHVRFNDHTGSLYPVTTAVSQWNQAANIDSFYLYNSCPFQAGARCIDVSEENEGNNGQSGHYTYTYTDTDYSFNESGGTAVFNNYYGPAAGNDYLGVACHELGHVLGLAHEAAGTPGACMNAPSGAATKGGSDDYNLLFDVYSVDR